MSSFPVLKTGAVIQFPAIRKLEFTTDVIQFIDGAEQRFRGYDRQYRSWTIRLAALDETELQRVRAFAQQNGATGLFSFTDPWDGTVYPSCRIDGTGLEDMLNGLARAATSVVIREFRT
jgi:phage-related protein